MWSSRRWTGSFRSSPSSLTQVVVMALGGDPSAPCSHSTSLTTSMITTVDADDVSYCTDAETHVNISKGLEDYYGGDMIDEESLSDEGDSSNESTEGNAMTPSSNKTIGFFGSVMLLINVIAGPTVVSMPALAQQSGWLPLVVVEAGVAFLSIACGLMVIEAVRRMPGNTYFGKKVEFNDLTAFYLPRFLQFPVMACYFVACTLTMMQLIIQSGQIIDYIILNVHGCAPGLVIGHGLRYVCGAATDSVTPFDDSLVLSSSMVLVVVISVPFALRDLDGSIGLQIFAISGLCVLVGIWIILLVNEPDFPTVLPLATTSQSALIGTVLFNFSFISTLPSWVNEKRPDVSIIATFGAAMLFVVVVYSLIGIVGGMAFAPFFETHENLFSKLNASGSTLGRATVSFYPMLQNFTSIPVNAILIRYNMIQSGLPQKVAAILAIALPWVMSVYFYTGAGFDNISEFGGLATSSVINFCLPVTLFLIAVWKRPRCRRSEFLETDPTTFRHLSPTTTSEKLCMQQRYLPVPSPQ
eukprot:TRINITY_DN3609_c0_g1_i5.p1 TRINITY_DN3609_c0_g1~~TRINITY_DN3609_c0_g1_i5.p1  ORF type:complete len:526 (+),score=75.76 TRINITY_DN3609_c0_g1_i5:124-1701(+)